MTTKTRAPSTYDPHSIHTPGSAAKQIARIARRMSTQQPVRPAMWRGSPFEFLLDMPPRRRGKVGEDLVEGYFARQSIPVHRAGRTDYDRLINEWRVEVKTSTLWESGLFAFQQIRDQGYDYCLCLGLAPRAVFAWAIPKTALHQHVIGHCGQHTGQRATDTWWLRFDPTAQPAWLQRHGDTMELAKGALAL